MARSRRCVARILPNAAIEQCDFTQARPNPAADLPQKRAHSRRSPKAAARADMRREWATSRVWSDPVCPLCSETPPKLRMTSVVGLADHLAAVRTRLL